MVNKGMTKVKRFLWWVGVWFDVLRDWRVLVTIGAALCWVAIVSLIVIALVKYV